MCHFQAPTQTSQRPGLASLWAMILSSGKALFRLWIVEGDSEPFGKIRAQARMPTSPRSPHPGKEKANGPTARRPPSGPPRPRRPAGLTPRLQAARGRCSRRYLHSQRLARRARCLRGGPQMPGWL